MAKSGAFADAFAQIDEAIRQNHPDLVRIITKSYVGYRVKGTKGPYAITISANEERLRLSLLHKPNDTDDSETYDKKTRNGRYVFDASSEDDLCHARQLVLGQ